MRIRKFILWVLLFVAMPLALVADDGNDMVPNTVHGLLTSIREKIVDQYIGPSHDYFIFSLFDRRDRPGEFFYALFPLRDDDFYIETYHVEDSCINKIDIIYKDDIVKQEQKLRAFNSNFPYFFSEFCQVDNDSLACLDKAGHFTDDVYLNWIRKMREIASENEQPDSAIAAEIAPITPPYTYVYSHLNGRFNFIFSGPQDAIYSPWGKNWAKFYPKGTERKTAMFLYCVPAWFGGTRRALNELEQIRNGRKPKESIYRH